MLGQPSFLRSGPFHRSKASPRHIAAVADQFPGRFQSIRVAGGRRELGIGADGLNHQLCKILYQTAEAVIGLGHRPIPLRCRHKAVLYLGPLGAVQHKIKAQVPPLRSPAQPKGLQVILLPRLAYFT